MKSLVVLGPGCPNCRRLAANAEQAARELALDVEIIKITDPAAIAGFGIVKTPALMIDDEIKVMGKVPSVEELKTLLS
ncbi:MAG: thioredoxin family protein [Candidatus Sumerlaeia bacterium]